MKYAEKVSKPIIFKNLDKFKDAYEIIKELIKYEKDIGKKFIFLYKEFWNNYYNFIYQHETNTNEKIMILINLHELLLSYIELDEDDSNYKEELAENIHNLIEKAIKNYNNNIKNQLEILFEKDPYYTSNDYQRNPNIFEYINILNLKEDENIKYFKKLDIENIYGDLFQEYIKIIIKKIEKVDDIITILKTIEIKSDENKRKYIALLIEKYSNFKDEDITEESFINLLEKNRPI